MDTVWQYGAADAAITVGCLAGKALAMPVLRRRFLI
jgi:hypothetical protein